MFSEAIVLDEMGDNIKGMIMVMCVCVFVINLGKSKKYYVEKIKT